MVTNKENLFKLGKKITNVIPHRLGLKKITEDDPEFWGLVNVLDDEMVEIALKMPSNRGYITLSELAKKCNKSEEYLEKKLQEMGEVGIIEWNWENEDHHKQYMLPMFVPGSAEFLNMACDERFNAHPEVTRFFNRMAFDALKKVTPMVPLGGAGIGMHVIPVEKAIPTDSQSVSVEHLSHWLQKYDKFNVGICSCRRAMAVQNEGSGEIEDYWCIGVGDMAIYTEETGKVGRPITREQAIEILQRAEEEGFVHQITNIDGENKIFAICNCAPGLCYALRTSQLFNTPNLSRSAYVAHVNKENCVACGKCAEVCPAGAAKMGQKLCTKSGPVKYPKRELPDEVEWSEEKWSPNWRDDNQLQCYDSGTAPCKSACPAHIAIQGYIKMAAEGRYLDALKLIKQDNPFPAVCGYVCNRRCEDACTRGTVDQPIAIDEIKKFIAEQEIKEENRYVPPIRSRKYEKSYEEKMAVIGAGPAGMSCAFYLAQMGYPVTVFEKEAIPGGMLTLGIPSFRLGRDVINAEIEVLKKMGVDFKCGVEVGKDKTLDDLRAEGYKAFFLGIGAQKSSPINIPGDDLNGVFGGVDFMKEVNLGKNPTVGNSVAVIGGGNVAMDVCRSAIRLGAEKVYVIYRRSENEMPADKAEVAEAKDEGVEFKFLFAPSEIIGDNGNVSAIRCEIMELGEADEKGRRKPVGTGKFEEIPVTAVIGAIGQKVDMGDIAHEAMTFNKNGTLIADEITRQTAQPDVFVGGDCLTGPKFAIDAVAGGREGAESMHRFVHKGQSLTLARNLRQFVELNKDDVVIPVSFDNSSRQVNGRDISRAKTMDNEIITFTEEQVKKEASRCLGCGACEVDENQCIGCGLCTTRCEFDAIHLSRDLPDASRMSKAEDKMKAILPYAAKRKVAIIKKNLGKK